MIYDGEPEKCYFYEAVAGYNDPSMKTVQYAMDMCQRWGKEFSFSCTLTTPKDKAKIQELLDNEVYRDNYRHWVGCAQTEASSEPAGGWVWQTPFPLGSTIPATSIPWLPKNGSVPQQPDNNGGNANQCVYNGGVGIQDENVDDFIPNIGNVMCECVDLPRNSSCSVQRVDPALMYYNPYRYEVYPNAQNCALKCAQETSFVCKAFVWKGPKSDCYLYGEIDNPVIKQSDSEWILIDLDCFTSISCQWPDNPKKINPATIDSRMIKSKAKNRDHCLALCLLGKRQPPCRAYAFSADPAHMQKNCYLFPALKPEKITAAAIGDFTLSQNSCH
uniref:Apple domain-containing protein n=1 Tax=Plectus sambesii TaxID=2011161 RepID=A0A914XJE9_9BILA